MKSTAGTVIFMIVVTFVIMLVGFTAFAPIKQSISNNAVKQYNGSTKQAASLSTRVGILNGILTVIPVLISSLIDRLIWKRHKALSISEQDNNTSPSDAGPFIYYCRNCGTSFSGDKNLDSEDCLCPSCGKMTLPTDTSLSKWQKLSEHSQNQLKQKWTKSSPIKETVTDDIVIKSKAKPKRQQDDIKEKLEQIKNYYESGLITAEEYDKKRKELIDSI